MVLTARQATFVAAYLGEAAGNGTQAARLAGYRGGPDSLKVTASRLLTNANVAAAVAAARAQVVGRGIAEKQHRLDSYAADFARTERVIAARATAYAAGPGGDTGLVVGQVKQLKDREAWEYALDAALLNERLKLRKQMAQELGEWVERGEQTVNVEVRAAAAKVAAELGLPVDLVLAETYRMAEDQG